MVKFSPNFVEGSNLRNFHDIFQTPWLIDIAFGNLKPKLRVFKAAAFTVVSSGVGVTVSLFMHESFHSQGASERNIIRWELYYIVLLRSARFLSFRGNP
jgi:hypothetical protein